MAPEKSSITDLQLNTDNLQHTDLNLTSVIPEQQTKSNVSASVRRTSQEDSLASFKRNVKPIRTFDVSDKHSSRRNHHDFVSRKKRLKKADESTVAIPSSNLLPSALIQSLLELLCFKSTRDEKEAWKLFRTLRDELIKHHLIDPSTLHDEEYQTIEQGHNMFNKIIRTTLKSLSIDQNATLLAYPFEKTSLNILRPAVKEEDFIRRNTGRYTNEFREAGILGKGGFGSVFKAENFFDGRKYAVKKIRFMQKQSNMVVKTLREVKALANLQHPNIVGYNSAWMEYDSPFSDSSSSGSPRTQEDSDSRDEPLDRRNTSGSPSIEFLSDADDEDEASGFVGARRPYGAQASHLAEGVGFAQGARMFSSVKKQEISSSLEDHTSLESNVLVRIQEMSGADNNQIIQPKLDTDKLLSCRLQEGQDDLAEHCSSCRKLIQSESKCLDDLNSNIVYDNCVDIDTSVIVCANCLDLDSSVDSISHFKPIELLADDLRDPEISSRSSLTKCNEIYDKHSQSSCNPFDGVSSDGFSVQPESLDKSSNKSKESKFYNYSSDDHSHNASIEFSTESHLPNFSQREMTSSSLFPTTFLMPRKQSSHLFVPSLFPKFGGISRQVSYSGQASSVKILSLDTSMDETEDCLASSTQNKQEIVLRKQHPSFGRSVSLAGNSRFGIFNSHDFQPSITLYIQMELCSLTLQEWLANRNAEFTPCSQNFSVMSLDNMRIFHQLLEGVDYIHNNGLIHRDLKPRNIFLLGSELHVKIGDFGLAKAGGGSSAPSSLNVSTVYTDPHTTGVGTSAYASPEQLKGSVYDSKSDMYSLGVVLYEMFHTYGTEMERATSIQSLRDSSLVDQDIWDKWTPQAEAMLSLTQAQPQTRPSTKELLQSRLFLSPDQQVKMLQQTLSDMRKEMGELRGALKDKNMQIRELLARS